jgi:hypothetical protein
METKTDIFLIVKKEDVGFITTIIESFEGVAAVRTPNPEPNSPHTTLHCMVSPDQMKQMEMIIRDLSKDHFIKRISPNEPPQAR